MGISYEWERGEGMEGQGRREKGGGEKEV